MAIARPLSFTSMIRLEMMLKAATTMISVRIRNMTLRSTWTALKKLALAALPVVQRGRRPPSSAAELARESPAPFRIVEEDLQRRSPRPAC